MQKGDRVAIFMAHVPENCAAMLACARIGAVHCVVFGGFSAEALAGRVRGHIPLALWPSDPLALWPSVDTPYLSQVLDSGAKIILTQDGVMRGSKLVPLKGIVDEAIPLIVASGGEDPRTVVLRRLGEEDCAGSMTMRPGMDMWWDEATAKASAETETEWVDAEDPSFILYTSGSTGKPKGILHTTGGYMLGAALSFKHVFAAQSNGKGIVGDGGDMYWCTADCGWITGLVLSCLVLKPDTLEILIPVFSRQVTHTQLTGPF